MEENTEISQRDETLSETSIDEEYVVRTVRGAWQDTNVEREEYLERRIEWEESWRNLTSGRPQGPWENASNFHVPLVLTYGKAVHARLWQLFSNPSGFFGVKARQEAFEKDENKVKEFMDWVWESHCNSKQGARREMDRWLWDVVFGGSGYLKVYWKREEHVYMDTVPITTTEEILTFDPNDLTGRPTLNTKTEYKEIERIDVVETPQIRRILYEDILMPRGWHDPQEAPWVVTPVRMTDEDLKDRVDQKIFWRDAVEASFGHKESSIYSGEQVDEIKQTRAEIDGFTELAYENDAHVILEWYGKAYVETRNVNENEFDQDIKRRKREIVAWIHKGSGRLLGWTYLSRVSPSGLRPLFKSDYVTFPERNEGVGVPELLYDIGRHTDTVYNLRVDNGTLASIPMFKYRNSNTSLKPAMMRIKPGLGIPCDDVQDIQQFNFPFLTNFGYQEEAALGGYAEKLLALSEINLGRAPDKVGALRNATGANLLSSEAGIQLEIHFDRIAHCLSRVLQFLFRLCRERIPGTLFYRVTGVDGKPIFGQVNRDDLKGEYDFNIQVDILGQSQLEKQQQSVLMMQTLINPAFMQTGVVTPANQYELAANFLRAHKLSRVFDYITPPQGYTGPIVTPAERLSRIIVGAYKNPPIAETVRLDEDHQKAIEMYEAFEQSDNYGLLSQPDQIAALKSLIETHQRLMMAQQAGGNPNMSGMQVPRAGFGPLPANIGGGGGTLQAPAGEANGPVV